MANVPSMLQVTHPVGLFSSALQSASVSPSILPFPFQSFPFPFLQVLFSSFHSPAELLRKQDTKISHISCQIKKSIRVYFVDFSSFFGLLPLHLLVVLLLTGLGLHLLYFDGVWFAAAHVQLMVAHAKGQNTFVDAQSRRIEYKVLKWQQMKFLLVNDISTFTKLLLRVYIQALSCRLV